jgi:hypothetical protein
LITQPKNEEITDYLTAKINSNEKRDTGLYYIINEPGTGKQQLTLM